MIRTIRSSALTLAALVIALHAPVAHAQTSDDSGWSRLSVTIRQSVIVPGGKGEAFALFNRDLTPGPRSLYVGLAGGELRWRVARDIHLVGGAESGGRTMATESRLALPGATSPARQLTTLGLSAMQYAGITYTPWHWRQHGTERARFGLAAGGGRATYRLHQWGQFVDLNRQITFSDDFVSRGSGAFGYASAQVEVPVWRGVALVGDVRRQFGSAPMSADFAQFDRIDLGGTRAGVGLTITPARLRR